MSHFSSSGMKVVGGRLVARSSQEGSGGQTAYPSLSSLFAGFELPLSLQARRYIASVYAALVVTFSFVFIGALIDSVLQLGGALTLMASFLLVLAISSMATTPLTTSDPPTPSPFVLRTGGTWARSTKKATWVTGVPNSMILLCLLGLCQGASIQPLLSTALHVHPLILPFAVLLTTILFLCLSLAALWIPKRAHMAVAALTSSTLTSFICMGILSSAVPGLVGGTGWMVMSLIGLGMYTVTDMQRLIEHAENGQQDYVFDGMMLFLHVLPVFIRIVTSLIQIAQQEGGRNAEPAGRNSEQRRRPPLMGDLGGVPMNSMMAGAASAYQQFGNIIR